MSSFARAILIALLMGITFVVDINLPLGVSASAGYLASILVTLWFRRVHATLMVASIATVLAFAGYALSPQRGNAWRAGTNRIIGVGTFWTTAGLIVLYRRANAARFQSEDVAQRRSDELQQLYRTAPVGLCLVDRDLRYLRINERLAAINGRPVEEHFGRTLREIIPEIAPQIEPIYRGVLDTGEPVLGREVRGSTGGDPGTERDWIVSYYPFLDEQGEIQGVSTVVQEITERKRMEESLREREATIRTLLESAPQAILAVRANGTIDFANRMAQEMFGHSREELLDQPVDTLLPERFRDRHADHRASYMAAPRPRPMGAGLELYACRKDGSEFPVDVSLGQIDTPNGPLAVSFISDISQRKREEKRLREAEGVHALASGLLRGQEEERRRVARELHDGLNQNLAALSIDLGALEKDPSEPESLRERLRGIGKRVAEMSEEVRHISHRLHPAALEYAGLVPALRSHCEEFGKQTGIRMHVATLSAQESIPREVATSLYRLAQEALHNVAKHSRATEVRVSLADDPEGTHLTITDNGRGFLVDQARKRGGLGLVSMEERVRSLGGRLSIESRPQEGTTVEVWVAKARGASQT